MTARYLPSCYNYGMRITHRLLLALVLVLAATTSVATLAVPAAADGVRVFRRAYPVGEISRNVITPFYVGYYGSHYSYYRPDPVPPPVYWKYSLGPACWAWAPYGRRYFVC
ncbi:MAG: hypothetical protein ACJ8F3_08490 [Xanthobacteraceae bacterium]